MDQRFGRTKPKSYSHFKKSWTYPQSHRFNVCRNVRLPQRGEHPAARGAHKAAGDHVAEKMIVSGDEADARPWSVVALAEQVGSQ